MLSMWDAPSERDYYDQFAPRPAEEDDEAPPVDDRTAKLAVEGLREVIGHLDAAIAQSHPSDDQILIGHIATASALAKGLARRMEVA
jgi:hypothetical protein